MLRQFAFRGMEILVSTGPEPRDELPVFDCREAALPDPEESVILPVGSMSRLYSPETETPRGWEWKPFRSVIGVLPERIWSEPARGLSLLNWRVSTKFCGRCGTPNGDKTDEMARLCPACGVITFPRISPAVLVAVVREWRLLLARNSLFRTGIWSLIAGFLEPGETFEMCICREVKEEVSVEVKPGNYLGSQPWPFPDQLMVGFSAEWTSGELRPDGKEIVEAEWFGPRDLPQLPLPGSLSRRIIDSVSAGIA